MTFSHGKAEPVVERYLFACDYGCWSRTIELSFGLKEQTAGGSLSCLKKIMHTLNASSFALAIDSNIRRQIAASSVPLPPDTFGPPGLLLMNTPRETTHPGFPA